MSFIGWCHLRLCQSLPPCPYIIDNRGRVFVAAQGLYYFHVFPFHTSSAIWCHRWEMRKTGVGMYTFTALGGVTSCGLFRHIKNIRTSRVEHIFEVFEACCTS